MVKVVLHSNLLSGGIEAAHINLFNEASLSQLRQHAEILGDKNLICEKQPTEPKNPIIHSGIDEEVDLTIEHLQKMLLKNRLKYAYAAVGGEEGMKLTRAAFGVMLKFSDLTDDFTLMASEVMEEIEGCLDGT